MSEVKCCNKCGVACIHAFVLIMYYKKLQFKINAPTLYYDQITFVKQTIFKCLKN